MTAIASKKAPVFGAGSATRQPDGRQHLASQPVDLPSAAHGVTQRRAHQNRHGPHMRQWSRGFPRLVEKSVSWGQLAGLKSRLLRGRHTPS